MVGRFTAYDTRVHLRPKSVRAQVYKYDTSPLKDTSLSPTLHSDPASRRWWQKFSNRQNPQSMIGPQLPPFSNQPVQSWNSQIPNETQKDPYRPAATLQPWQLTNGQESASANYPMGRRLYQSGPYMNRPEWESVQPSQGSPYSNQTAHSQAPPQVQNWPYRPAQANPSRVTANQQDDSLKPYANQESPANCQASPRVYQPSPHLSHPECEGVQPNQTSNYSTLSRPLKSSMLPQGPPTADPDMMLPPAPETDGWYSDPSSAVSGEKERFVYNGRWTSITR